MEIKAEILSRMVQHAVREHPFECCGMLTSRGKVTDGIYPCKNEAGSRSRFFVPPPQLFEFFRHVRQQKSTFAGIYHSHPEGDPVPSSRDIEEFHYPEASYWIISLKKARPSVGCYEWDAGLLRFIFVDFEIVSDPWQHRLTHYPDLSISKACQTGVSGESPIRFRNLKMKREAAHDLESIRDGG